MTMLKLVKARQEPMRFLAVEWLIPFMTLASLQCHYKI